LGVPIVERGQRFHGLTKEGERALKWSHAILDEWSSLRQEISKLRNAEGTLVGRLSLGVIPSGALMVALIAKAKQDRHAGIEFTVLSQSSVKILRSLEDFSIDVGLTYLDSARSSTARLRTPRKKVPRFSRGEDTRGAISNQRFSQT
jgi:DNA-binding transcriptional LysR family regulator